MAKLAQIKDRNSKIEKGAWVKDLPNLQDLGVAVQVRGYGNSDHLRVTGEEYAKLSEEQRKDKELTYEIDGRLIVQTLLLDWKGIDDLPFNAANAKRAMTDPDLAILRGAIDFATKTVAQNGHETLEADAKK
jgi:hypothetical protein